MLRNIFTRADLRPHQGHRFEKPGLAAVERVRWLEGRLRFHSHVLPGTGAHLTERDMNFQPFSRSLRALHRGTVRLSLLPARRTSPRGSILCASPPPEESTVQHKIRHIAL